MPPKKRTASDAEKAEPAEDLPSQSLVPSSEHNAFTELMARKQPKPPSPEKKRTISSTSDQPPSWTFDSHNARNGLLAYIQTPETNPNNLVIDYTKDFTLIQDGFPKSTIHLLILPRDLTKSTLDPRVALSQHPDFLASVRAYASTAALLASKELARRIGKFSAMQKAHLAAVESAEPDADPSTLPPARDYLSSLNIGVHAHPSMTHLHIHICSPDMHSPALKHRKHYNSFNTPFLIPLADFPLSLTDERWRTAFQNGNLAADFVCWRCGKSFGNRFAELKRHLDTEWEAWCAV